MKKKLSLLMVALVAIAAFASSLMILAMLQVAKPSKEVQVATGQDQSLRLRFRAVMQPIQMKQFKLHLQPLRLNGKHLI